jgi:hypothetical protein
MDVLGEILKIEPGADVKSENFETHTLLGTDGQQKTLTTHFKMTQTKITEIEREEINNDKITQQQDATKEQNKHKGCFGKCFKKRKGKG